MPPTRTTTHKSVVVAGPIKFGRVFTRDQAPQPLHNCPKENVVTYGLEEDEPRSGQRHADGDPCTTTVSSRLLVVHMAEEANLHRRLCLKEKVQ
jgi:hypothetical protein